MVPYLWCFIAVTAIDAHLEDLIRSWSHRFVKLQLDEGAFFNSRTLRVEWSASHSDSRELIRPS